MAENSKIEWCTHTFNTHWGCTKISDACENCYAENIGNRFGVKWGAGEPRKLMSDDYWSQPLKWNKRAGEKGIRERVFCASMGDVFDNEVSPHIRARLLQLIKDTPHLDWLLLTKRISNAQCMLDEAVELIDTGMGVFVPSVYPNLWLGITVCNQLEANRDIPKLLDIPVNIHFLSIEPMLEHINLNLAECYGGCGWITPINVNSDKDLGCPNCGTIVTKMGLGRTHGSIMSKRAIDWVIVGGESGVNARPMHPAWASSIQKQCNQARVPFFFKQQGEWALEQIQAGGDLGGDMRKGIVQQVCLNRENDGYFKRGDVHMRRVSKSIAGRMLNGVEYNELPNYG